MGVYINSIDSPRIGKTQWLIERGDAREVNILGYEVQPTDVLVCCVLNLHRSGSFDAAAIMFDEKELHDWLEPEYADPRPKRWLVMDRSRAFALAGVPDPQLEAQ